MSIGWFNGLLTAWFVMAVGSFISLFFKPAPYGRYFETGWGKALNARAGWILMEAPAALVLPIWYLTSDRIRDPAAIAFVLLWSLHYLHRAFIYPMKKTAGRPMPFFLAACAMAFNMFNGSFNGAWLFHLSPGYESSWLLTAPFLIGTAVFLLGFVINLTADYTLLRLRAQGERYQVPQGLVFRWVSCPNYLGEILEWFGWAILTWSVAGLSFAVWTAANLAPRAITHHRFYREKVEGYPTQRRALIPYLF